jgi:hypothetical protein
VTEPWLPPVEAIAASFAGGGGPKPPSVLVNTARHGNRGLATLLSWWKLRGETLPEPLQAELRYHGDRLARYATVLARLRDIEPGLVPAKGPTVWGLYPPGLVRQTADLDLIMPHAAGLWTGAGFLHGEGWSPAAAWAWQLADRVHFHVVMERPSPEPLLMPDEQVELFTVAYWGDHLRRPPRHRTWPNGTITLADCLLWLLEELGERRLYMRDMFDLAVLGQVAGDDDIERFTADAAALVSGYGARPQLRRLIRQARRHYPEALPMLSGIAAQARLGRPQLPWPLYRHPLATSVAAAAALSKVRRSTAVRDRADDALVGLQRQVSVHRLLARGIPLYCMPLPESMPVAEVVVSCGDDGAVWLDTPVGRFVGTLGSAVAQDWIHQATKGGPVRTTVRLG